MLLQRWWLDWFISRPKRWNPSVLFEWLCACSASCPAETSASHLLIAALVILIMEIILIVEILLLFYSHCVHLCPALVMITSFPFFPQGCDVDGEVSFVWDPYRTVDAVHACSTIMTASLSHFSVWTLSGLFNICLRLSCKDKDYWCIFFGDCHGSVFWSFVSLHAVICWTNGPFSPCTFSSDLCMHPLVRCFLCMQCLLISQWIIHFGL